MTCFHFPQASKASSAPVIFNGIDPYHSAAMLSLGGIKSSVFAGKPRPDANSVRGLPRKNKAFYSLQDSTWPPSDKGLLKFRTAFNHLEKYAYNTGQ